MEGAFKYWGCSKSGALPSTILTPGNLFVEDQGDEHIFRFLADGDFLVTGRSSLAHNYALHVKEKCMVWMKIVFRKSTKIGQVLMIPFAGTFAMAKVLGLFQQRTVNSQQGFHLNRNIFLIQNIFNTPEVSPISSCWMCVMKFDKQNINIWITFAPTFAKKKVSTSILESCFIITVLFWAFD